MFHYHRCCCLSESALKRWKQRGVAHCCNRRDTTRRDATFLLEFISWSNCWFGCVHGLLLHILQKFNAFCAFSYDELWMLQLSFSINAIFISFISELYTLYILYLYYNFRVSMSVCLSVRLSVCLSVRTPQCTIVTCFFLCILTKIVL